ncbi:uncharacterized protein PHALS_15429 [Plasmopara halstedii]|uniref:Uncharacterized protein n=1 Tax=Plasmopara halstedii TaxID=4781 RepID=A0A0P1AGS5_PLAHL|nr:uncharacterized protein PHALS_15429 [Plasmopara halstedii]CEG40146.1 hypothetical protein PHALS_15429 [Plasmopara halstedii]|eukprot:XP_024576515.1 hypothetical protein PHALS_15429 [Plasmopara halstedii]
MLNFKCETQIHLDELLASCSLGSASLSYLSLIMSKQIALSYKICKGMIALAVCFFYLKRPLNKCQS